MTSLIGLTTHPGGVLLPRDMTSHSNKACGSAECREGDRVKEGENTATGELIQDVVYPGCGVLPDDANVTQLTVVDSEANPARFLGYDGHRVHVWEGGVLYETSHEIFAQTRTHLFGHDSMHAVGARCHWCAARGDRHLEGQERA